MAPTVRRMNSDDVESVSKLLFDMMASDPSYISHGELQMGIAVSPAMLASNARDITSRELHAQVEENPETMLIAEADGKIAGFVSARIETQFETSYGVIADIAVHPNFQRQGIATLLMKRVMGSFQTSKVSRVFLESGLNNHSAHEFFARFGFEAVSKVFAADVMVAHRAKEEADYFRK